MVRLTIGSIRRGRLTCDSLERGRTVVRLMIGAIGKVRQLVGMPVTGGLFSRYIGVWRGYSILGEWHSFKTCTGDQLGCERG